MDIFSVLTLIGGLALFLYGMNVMSGGLEKLSGGKLEKILEKLTSNRFKAVIFGLGVTAVIQSSSATTVMVVGFVNAGIMQLDKAVGVIMGANVGTTATSWILSLSGIQSNDVVIQLFKPTSFSPVLAIIGVILLMMAKSDKKKLVGTILIGFAVLMFGMNMMSGAMEPLADDPGFAKILLLFSNPLFGVIAGCVLTAVIQSSSASVGILQALCVSVAMPFSSVVPIIMGQNIGTCVTAMISAIGATKNGKRTAFVHLYFNVIGTLLFLIIFYLLNAVIGFDFVNENATPAGIAIVHSIFNIFATLILLPFTKGLVKLACLTVRDTKKEKEKEDEFSTLDDRFLHTPSFAIERCRALAGKMAELSRDTLLMSIGMMKKYDERKAKVIIENENKADEYEDKLGTYLVKISSQDLSFKDSQSLTMLLHSIGDFERISDHAVNILEAAQEMKRKNLEFSTKATEELRVIESALSEALNKAVDSFLENDAELAKTIEPLEEVIDSLRSELKKRHIKRLRKGKCTIELGFVLTDLITNYERVSDHCSNIAVTIIQINENSFDTHEYLNELKRAEDNDFAEQYLKFHEKYMLP